MDKVKRKKIKITSRGMVLTSRGMARTPILRPYYETLDAILIMLSRYNAEIIEVLDDGREIKIDVNNFNTDNMKEPEKIETIPVRKDEPEKVIPPTAPITKNMSRKERKRLEYERKKAEELAAAPAEQPKQEETPVQDKIIKNEEVENNDNKSENVELKDEVLTTEPAVEESVSEEETKVVTEE